MEPLVGPSFFLPVPYVLLLLEYIKVSSSTTLLLHDVSVPLLKALSLTVLLHHFRSYLYFSALTVGVVHIRQAFSHCYSVLKALYNDGGRYAPKYHKEDGINN